MHFASTLAKGLVLTEVVDARPGRYGDAVDAPKCGLAVSPTFRRGPVERPSSESAERLFDDLPRTRDRAPSLWAHQADMLRQYHANHLHTPDIALELPTGAGKTLPALLIGEWRRSTLGCRVAYACPTVQLAHQVHAEALRQGISAVTLVRSHHDWNTADTAKYDAARELAVTTYSHIFNSSPAISQPGTLLFDDAHSAEQYVAAAWSFDVSRYRDPELYLRLLDAIKGELSGLHLQRLQARDADPATRTEVRLLPAAALRRRAGDVDRVLGALGAPLIHRYAMIRHNLERCLFYFGWEGFLIRPYIVPTSGHPLFVGADQRIYISATLGDGGELERAFGRAPIERLPVPAGWDQRGSGRRFFVFPELIRGLEARSLARAVINQAGKALVISPSDRRLEDSKLTLVPSGMETFGKGDIEESLDRFGRAARGALALANRYDGLDLADESCRLTVLDGLPFGQHLQERFLVQSLRAPRVLEERLRTRVVQGAGRCTRGLKDHSAVIILGDDLTRFLQRREVLDALRPETQAEIRFGIANSEVGEQQIRAAMSSFLNQDDEWQNEAEPYLAELRREASRNLPPGTESLASTAAAEVKAWRQVWRGEYEAASVTAVEVSQRLTEGILAPYRALWLYFAAAWQEAAAEQSSELTLAVSARELLRKAHAAAQGTLWLREVAPLPPGEVVLDPLDEVAVKAVAEHPVRKLSGTKWTELANNLLHALGNHEPEPYEQALTTLGGLLGAETFKPEGKGRADSVWIFGDEWWLTLEAKSAEMAEGLVSMENVRQANTQLRSLAVDRNAPVPDGSVSVIVTPKQLADPDAVAIAEPHLCMCHTSEILSLANDAIQAIREIRSLATNLEGTVAEDVVRQRLTDWRVLPTAVRERIADRRVAA